MSNPIVLLQKLATWTGTLSNEKMNISGVESVTGTATFTNSTNNINLSGIGSQGWEVGDVISVSGSTSNDQLYTIEVITNSNNVVVNYEHRGGTTSKSLVDESSTSGVTVELVCKYYVAPIGLGQGWCNPATSRSADTEYSNNTNRTIVASYVYSATDNSNYARLLIDGVTCDTSSAGQNTLAVTTSAVIPPDATFERQTNSVSLSVSRELR